jgi:hypothetical protein
MRDKRQALVMATLLLAAGTAWALSEPAPDDADNRALVSQIRRDKVHHARLMRDLQTYNRLAPEVRARIQILDREVQAEPSADQLRLLRAGERYADWLASLTPEERTRIESEPDKDRRLAIIKEIRQRQWVERLPTPLRERIETAKESDRQALLTHLRSEQRRWRQDWQLALRQWEELSAHGLPDRLEKLPPEAQTFITKELLPRLRGDERTRLKEAEEHWPQYPRTLAELVDSESVGFRLLNPIKSSPTTWDDLPADFHKKIRQSKLFDGQKLRLNRTQGHWPGFALAVTDVARTANIPLPRQFGPCVPKDFDKPVHNFIQQKLLNFNTSAIDKDERERLRSAAGLWPLFPRTVWEVAHKHHLDIPGASLPGPPGYWDSYRPRAAAPDDRSVVSDLALRVFVETELTDAERAELGVALSDPTTRERLQQEYVKRHPEEWQKIVETDKQKRAKKAAKAG